MLISFFLKQFFVLGLDCIYPPTCVCCRNDGKWLCAECQNKISFHSSKDGVDSSLEARCVWMGAYANPVLRALLTNIKYRSAHCLLPVLVDILRIFRMQKVEPWPWVGEPKLVITAVPSDKRRLRERGIDHTALLIEILQAELVPWAERSNLLRRKKHVQQNANLPTNELRKINVRGVFEVCQKISSPVLLIDDVYTTGATWHEAEQTLITAGAPRVYGFFFAKG